MRCATLLLLCSLAGCAGSPQPDPAAPIVLTDIVAPLDCPEPEIRTAPADLTAPLEVEAPQLVPAGQGDYGITRQAVEAMIDALRAAGERLARWRAWGG